MSQKAKKIVVYTSDYFCGSKKRRREIQMVQNANVKLGIIAKIVVLYENWDSVSKEVKQSEYAWLTGNKKFQVVNWPRRQSYRDFYEHSKKHNPDNIICICNSDVYFDSSLARVNELQFSPNTLYAISRWDRAFPDKDKSVWTPPFQSRPDMNWSFEMYCFTHPLNLVPESIDIGVGIGGCDSYLVKKLVVDNNIKVYNPCVDIMLWHQDYRQEENQQKDYFNTENYNTRSDYPGGARNWPHAVVPYGGQIGIKMTNVLCETVVQQRMYVKKQLKVISFSLWGAEPKYTLGAIKNAELALDMYPEWRCWFWIHEQSVPKEIVQQLKEFPNVDIIPLADLTLAMSMRFRAIDHPSVGVMISRDTDSQLGARERAAVDQWLMSDKALHVMRDHPHHGSATGHRIMGGMFGMKRVGYWQGWDAVLKAYASQHGRWGLDQDILQQVVYPLFNLHNDIMVHASFNKFESHALDFPTEFDDKFHFVGEYHYWDGTRNLEHSEMIRHAVPQHGVQCKKLKADTCLVSCNMNDFYLDFFPLVHAMWRDVCGVRCVLILVGTEVPEKLNKYRDDIILFTPEPGMSDVFQAQMLRMLYAGLIENVEGVHVSDMDLLPMRKSYYVDIPQRFDNDRFVVYRDVIVQDKQYPICFNVAAPSIWREIFGVQSEAHVRTRLREWYPKGFNGAPGESGWFSDQLLLFQLVNNWNMTKGNRLVLLNDNMTGFKRLDRLDTDSTSKNMSATVTRVNRQEYTDFHMPRPYSQYKQHILELVKGLLLPETFAELQC